MTTDCGLLGSAARRSITTFLGAGGNCLPLMVITLRPTCSGGAGGASRITIGSGVEVLAGCCLMTKGGAGGAKVLCSCWMMISPGAGGVGGLRYLMANSCT
ncbi:hypothetical protein BpHYR1_043589 [Brachionus plicatilis]|uniref:Uncharacterized protein n=1 Tax=Brachionus plicatilis TaxID=10195 RepID=A0A3M7SZX7_BRAPC|nr:hypothetical protein BpHYR1_043589 [Brachionus plicatilis]